VATELNQRRRRLLIWGILVSAGAVFALGAGLVVLLLRSFDDVARAAGEAASAAREYRDAGLPWEAKDVWSRPRPSAADNAAPVLLQAFAALDEDHLKSETPQIQALIQKGSFGRAAEKISQFKLGLNLAVSATSRESLDFKRDWDLGTQLIFREYVQAKVITRTLCLRAQIESAQGNSADASRDLRACWRLGWLVAQEPSLISMLVQVSIQRIVLDAAVRCAFYQRTSGNGLKAIEDSLDPGLGRPDIDRALRGEAYMGLTTIRNLKNLGGIKAFTSGDPLPPIPSSQLVRTGIPTDPISRAFAARHFQVWTEVMGDLRSYGGDPMKLGATMDKIVEDASKRKTVSNALNELMFPVYSPLASAVLDLYADTTATRALLEALQIRVRTGKLPTSIDQIPGTWIDPFTGKPLLVRSGPDSLRIYSVGPNLNDDGGVVKSEAPEDKPLAYDLAACYPPPKLKAPK